MQDTTKELPKFQEFCNPILKVLKNHNSLISHNDLLEEVVKLFNFTKEVLNISTIKNPDFPAYKDR